MRLADIPSVRALTMATVIQRNCPQRRPPVRGKDHPGVGEREREDALLKLNGVQKPRDSFEQTVGRGYIPSFGHFSSTSRLISSLMTISGGHSRLSPSMGPLAVASMPTLLP